QFLGHLWNVLAVRAKRTLLDDDVLAVDPAKLSHPVPKWSLARLADHRWQLDRNIADPVYLSRWLRLGTKRAGKHTRGHGLEEPAAVQHGAWIIAAVKGWSDARRWRRVND